MAVVPSLSTRLPLAENALCLYIFFLIQQVVAEAAKHLCLTCCAALISLAQLQYLAIVCFGLANSSLVFQDWKPGIAWCSTYWDGPRRTF